jgi:L-iditol 2-dehydrogenase
MAIAYGADEFVATTSHSWLPSLDSIGRPDIVVEAVGHQRETIVDAIYAAAQGGFIYGFGGVDDDYYAIPYRRIYEMGLTLAAGRTIDNWQSVLYDGAAYLVEHRAGFGDYVSHIVPLADAQMAYSLYASPQVGRLKVAILNSD